MKTRSDASFRAGTIVLSSLLTALVYRVSGLFYSLRLGWCDEKPIEMLKPFLFVLLL